MSMDISASWNNGIESSSCGENGMGEELVRWPTEVNCSSSAKASSNSASRVAIGILPVESSWKAQQSWDISGSRRSSCIGRSDSTESVRLRSLCSSRQSEKGVDVSSAGIYSRTVAGAQSRGLCSGLSKFCPVWKMAKGPTVMVVTGGEMVSRVDSMASSSSSGMYSKLG